ncbi:intermembrane lipid transfer protein VPS13B-like [Diadema antillarum]|uniref:intermembrane lipid transfer protein VPS13B-like n=1 Tax=Diadema antillarum TaxID=105358 RepID=UPI003A8B6DED
MLESYISPFLLGYVDKYIKNLKPEDLQLSLWGGDLVLNNLELRLDALERDLNLPLTFVSGIIHELRIHVPWTKIGYEPVEISINTIECTLKLKDAGMDDGESVSSKSSVSTSKSKGESKPKPKEAVQDASLSPGYVTSLMNRMLHNVRVSVKNLILKYVEDDIVLSINVQSIETFATNSNWETAFLELSLPELVLRRVCNFSDITVCLDKRSASGKIEVYQEPVVFRCAVSTRVHLTYNSLNAKRVGIVKVSTHCEELEMSLSDTQLPMFLRVLELVLALYYGTIQQSDDEKQDQGEVSQEQDQMTGGTAPAPTDDSEEAPANLDPSNGWMNWAWSLVPEILTYEDEEENVTRPANLYGGGRLQKRRDPILSVGFYCNRASLEFKTTNPSGEQSLYTRPKLSFQRTLLLELGGVAIDVLMKGEPFFAAQLGISQISLSGIGSCPCGVDDHGSDARIPEDRDCYITCGDRDYRDKRENFMSQSLFDGSSPENNHQKTIYILDGEHHQNVYTETGAVARFGALWMDYLFTYEKLRGPDGNDSSSRSSHHSDTDPIFNAKETSWKRFVIAPASITLNSSLVYRIQQVTYYGGNHDYEPYSTPKPEIIDETRPVPTQEQVSGLEEFVPLRHTHLAVLGLEVRVHIAEHGPYDPTGTSEERFPVVPPTDTPVVKVTCQRSDFQVTVPMYARVLVKAASKVLHPSSALMHYCYSHTSLKVFGLQVGLTTDPTPTGPAPPYHPLLQPFSFAGLSKSLCMQMYWTDPSLVKSEMMLEVPAVRLDLTKAQLLLLLAIQRSWMGRNCTNTWLQETSLMEDVYSNPGQAGVLVSLSSLEMRYATNDDVKAVTGSIGQFQLSLRTPGDAVPTPVFQGPLQTDKLHLTTSMTHPPTNTSGMSSRSSDTSLLTFTVQLPQKDSKAGSLGCVLVKLEGTALCLDPALYAWLLYQPARKVLTSPPKNATHSTHRNETTGIKVPYKRSSSQGSGIPKAPKSGSRFSRQKSVTATPLNEDTEAEATEASSQAFPVIDLIVRLRDLVFQVDVEPCIIACPTEHMDNIQSPTTTIPQCIIDLANPGQRSNDQSILVVCVPCLSVHSSGHKAVDPAKDIPLTRMDLPQELGEKFPWTIKAANLSIYTVHPGHHVHYMLKPMAVSTTLALTVGQQPPSGAADHQPTLGLGIHTDMPSVVIKCSCSQVTLLSTLLHSFTSRQTKLLQAFWLVELQTPSHPPSQPSSPKQGGDFALTPHSPSKSVPHPPAASSQASSGQPDSTIEMESESVQSATLHSSRQGGDGPAGREREGGGVKTSVWVQWTLHKLSLVLYGKKQKTGMAQDELVKVCADMEDLATSIDIQDVYSKVTCKVGVLNIFHFIKRNEAWDPGPFQGMVLSCTDTVAQNVELAPPFKRPRTNSQPSNPFSLHSSKAAESKQTYAFLSLTWTRALGMSIAQKMFGGKFDKQGHRVTPSDEYAKQKRYVSEVILSSRSFDLIAWCPVLTTALVVFSATPLERRNKQKLEDGSSGRTAVHMETISEQEETLALGAASDAMSWRSVSQRSARSLKSVKSIKAAGSSRVSTWLTSASLPLLYLDCQRIRTFVPAGPSASVESRLDQDLFLFQVSQISLVPYADNPLQRLVVKQDIFRKAVHAGITQHPGSEVEDRQYQLDIHGIGVSVTSLEQVIRASEQDKVKVRSGVTLSKTQNPALEWNLSLPKQDPEQVQLTPVVQEFDLRLVVAPAIVMEKQRPDRNKQMVVICGHSVEFHVTTDMTFYLGTEQLHLAQRVLDSNLLSLIPDKPSPADPAHHNSASSSTKSTPLEDSGLGSEGYFQSTAVEKMELPHQTATSPPSSLKPAKLVAGETGGKQSKNKSRLKGVTPCDFLITGRKMTVFLYSRDIPDGAPDSASPGKDDVSSQPQPASIRPFLQLLLSQPSLVVSVEKEKQKFELSVYDFTVDGASMNREVQAGSLPQPGDFPVPWFETCPGMPDPKTGVRPSLLTFSVTDFMMQNGAAVRVLVKRPIKVNFSLSKVDQARAFLKRLQPVKSQRTEAPREVEEIQLLTTPRDGTKAVGISLPGLQGSQKERRKPVDRSAPEGVLENLMMLSHIQDVLFTTSQVVVVMATLPDPDYPHIVASVGATMIESAVVFNQKTAELFHADSSVQLCDLALKTSLQHRTRPLVGPFNFDLHLRTNHEPHSASEISPLLPRFFADLDIKHIPVYFGQEHLNCLKIVASRLSQAFLHDEAGVQKKQPPAKKFKMKPGPSVAGKPSDFSDLVEDDTSDENRDGDWELVGAAIEYEVPEGVIQVEHKDDLRTGAFEYFTDGHTDEDIPLPNEIYFTPPSQEAGHWGTMTWTYPEPRMDIGLTITPVPISNPDKQTFAKTKKIPCVLLSYEECSQKFRPVREFFVSETQRYHSVQTIEESRDLVEDMAAYSTWRVMLNCSFQSMAQSVPMDPPGPDVILTPMALAASMQFDTIFAPRFIQFCRLNITMSLLEVRLANHLSQLGKATPEYLAPFTPDDATPNDHEFLVIRIPGSHLVVESYGGVHARTRVGGDTEIAADLLNYGDLTMTPLLEPTSISIGYSFRGLRDIEGTLNFGNMTVMVGQCTVHTLSKAAEGWAQNMKPEVDRLFYGYYLICNATNQKLRFGQVHTDESIILQSNEVHEYSWRSHKQEKQELHVCMEGWRNFRWSEPFGIDMEEEETLVRILHNKNETATLFIQVRKTSAMQRQVILSGPQKFASQLAIPLDIQITRASHSAPRTDSTETSVIAPFSSLPTLTCSDEDITGVRVKVQGSACEWSEQFAVSGEMSTSEMVIKVPFEDGRKFYFWCQISAFVHGDSVQRLVLFSPLFTIQSHLPFPLTIHCLAARGNHSQTVQVRGQGSYEQLYQIPPMAWYNLRFASGMEATSTQPAVCVSTEMFPSITQQREESVGLRAISFSDDDDLSSSWPYNHPDYTCSKHHSTSLHHMDFIPCAETPGHPQTSLQVGMVQHRPAVNTIRIEVMPWCLFVNECQMDVTILEEGGETVRVEGGTTVAPPKYTGKISLTLSSKNEEYVSSELMQLVEEMDTPPKKNESAQSMQLKPEDYRTMELVSRGSQHGMRKTVHVTICSTVKHNTRIITVKPRFVFANKSNQDVLLRAVNLKSKEKTSIQVKSLETIALNAKSSHSSEHTPLLQWDSPMCNQPMGSFHYMALALSDQSAMGNEWSAWVEISDGLPRIPLPIPISRPIKTFQTRGVVTVPMVVMVYQYEGVTHVTVDDDPSPKMLVINKCAFPVHVAQSPDSALPENALEIEEERGPLPKVPVVPPGEVVHFVPNPSGQTKQTNVYKFHFALAAPPGSVSIPSPQNLSDGTQVEGHQWSEAIDIIDSCNPTRSEIVAMPMGGYLLVASECVGTLIHVFLDSLNSKDDEEEDCKDDTPQISQSISTSSLVIMVMNDLSQGKEVQEMLRVTADGVSFIVVAREDLRRRKALHSVHLLQLTVNSLQIDNQSHGSGGYDFPVIFRGLERTEDNVLPEINPNLHLTPERWYNFVYCEAQENRETSFLSLHVFVESSEGFGDHLRNAEIALNDMEVFIEDQLLLNAKDLFKTYSPGLVVTRPPSARTGVPSMVDAAMCALRSPIGLQQLTILPITLTASVHASVKMFISLDQTKLRFQCYETGPIYATHRQLGQALTLHYTSGALFKAGWAIGSLDLIGNPAGFLRSVRTGLFDTVYLPYEGLTRGPAAFVSGVASGMSSLVRHLSAGTLTSITKFASSVSRNLDRLSLDADHVARREEERRHIPDRMSSGIVQGLSSFGISLLGAIAGIADQPLRSLQDMSDHTTSSPGQRARGIISGVGKGLVGAVVKPLGGAAELVAQTGQGILHGTGLAEKLSPLGDPHSHTKSDAANSRLKYAWKMLCTLPNSDILFHVEVTSVTVNGLQREGALLLTPEVLYVVSVSEDTQQLTLPLCDIVCRPIRFNEKGIKIVIKRQKSPLSEKTTPAADRVADYVAATSDTSAKEDELTVSSDSPSETSGQSSQEVERTYDYNMPASLRESFLAHYSCAKDRLTGVGFCYDESDNAEFSRFKTWHFASKPKEDAP